MSFIRAFIIELLVQAIVFALSLSGSEYAWRTNPATPVPTVYFWFPTGSDATAPPSVPPGWTVSCPSDYTIGDWHWQWGWRVDVPASARPGTYSVGHTEVTVGASARPNARSRLVQRIAPGLSLPAARNAVNAGLDILLDPGLHTWRASLSVPSGTTITGYHATIQRVPNGEYEERVFVPQGGMTLEGVTLTHADGIWPVYIHNYPAPAGRITVKHCTLKGGELIRCDSREMLVQNCRFERASTGQVPSLSVWDHCEFVGHTKVGRHAFFNTGADGLLVTNCTWTGTNRGIVFQTGPCRGSLVANCYFTGISGGEANANEVILLEAGADRPIPVGEGMRENTFVDMWVTDSAGPAVCLFGSGMDLTRLWNIHASVENTGLMVCAMGGGEIGWTEVTNLQTTGGIDVRGQVGNLKFGNLQVFERPQMAGNQGPFTHVLKQFNENFPFNVDRAAREFCTFTFYGSNLWKSDRSQVVIEDVP